MRLRQVGDVDIVAYRRAVRGRVVGTQDLQRRAAAENRIEHQRHEMGLDGAALADLALGIRTGGVEVAQGGVA
mgnify:CR=1 FL=1